MVELGLTEKVFEYQGTHYRQVPTAINVRCIMLIYFQVGGQGSAKASRSMELSALGPLEFDER